MPETLLQTKLYTPPLRLNLVPRPRLIERLNHGLQQGSMLILVSAPAGYGKTTLLSEWVQQTKHPTTWLALDKSDNDPVRFLAYLVAALQRIPGLDKVNIGESFLSTRQTTSVLSAKIPSSSVFLTSLINKINECTDPFTLILDDFHVIAEQEVHDAVKFLVDNRPIQMNLIVSSRTDPPWPLARLRSHRDLTEVRDIDLRFTTGEATEFVNDVMGLNLSSENLAVLEKRTEGWIVGLQMAALSMQGQTDVSGFIKAFSGSHRFVLDYLIEEVLEQQPKNTQEFLLKSSILERMTASLCNAVTGCDESQVVLVQLDNKNLFLIPLDDERHWYRYHHLFSDLLRRHLEQINPDQVPVLHQQASEWYERTGLIIEAVNHALAAGDVERVARLVEGNALAMMDHGELGTLVDWLDALPEEVVCTRPWLCVAYAWALINAGHFDAVEPRLLNAEEALLEIAAEESNLYQHVTGHIESIRAYSMTLTGDISRAAEFALKALDRLPKRDLITRAWATTVLASGYRHRGGLEAANRTLTKAIAISQASSDNTVTVYALCDLARLNILQGELHKAAATCQDALQLADEYVKRSGHQIPVIGHAYTHLSSILREWNSLKSALRYAKDGLELCKQWGHPVVIFYGFVEVARVLQAIEDEDGALHANREANHIASTISTWHVACADAREAQLRLLQGDVTTAARWVRKSKLSVDDEISFQNEIIYCTLSRVLIAQGKSDEALRLLARLMKMAEAAAAKGYMIELLILMSIALQKQGKMERALIALERALSLAEPEGHVRSFIDEGGPMGKLLRQAATRGTALDYTGRLLAALEKETKNERWMKGPTSSPPVEPLTERELEVMRLLITHLTSTDIAEQLTISANTVRTHTKSIYSKLDVHSREEAVKKAEKLNLL